MWKLISYMTITFILGLGLILRWKCAQLKTHNKKYCSFQKWSYIDKKCCKLFWDIIWNWNCVNCFWKENCNHDATLWNSHVGVWTASDCIHWYCKKISVKRNAFSAEDIWVLRALFYFFRRWVQSQLFPTLSSLPCPVYIIPYKKFSMKKNHTLRRMTLSLQVS